LPSAEQEVLVFDGGQSWSCDPESESGCYRRWAHEVMLPSGRSTPEQDSAAIDELLDAAERGAEQLPALPPLTDDT
jgi:hypothetical protein